MARLSFLEFALLDCIKSLMVIQAAWTVSVLMHWWLTQSSFSAFRTVLPWPSWATAELVSGDVFFWREFPKWSFCLLALKVPSQNHQGWWPKPFCGKDTVLVKHWLNSLVLSLSCENIAFIPRFLQPPLYHTQKSPFTLSLNYMMYLCLPAHSYIMKIGPSCFCKDFSGNLLFGEAAHGEAFISLCGNEVQGVYFGFFPLATWAAKTCNLQELEAPCRKLA